MVRGTPHKARDEAHLTDKQRAQRDAALVLCRALDEAIGASGCSVKGACVMLAERILADIAYPQLIEAATLTYVKPRASGQTVASLTARLQKMYPLFEAGRRVGDPGLYLVPGAPEPTGYDPIHTAVFLRHYCLPVRPSVMDAWRAAETWFAEQHLPRPAVDTFYRIEKSLPVSADGQRRAHARSHRPGQEPQGPGGGRHQGRDAVRGRAGGGAEMNPVGMGFYAELDNKPLGTAR